MRHSVTGTSFTKLPLCNYPGDNFLKLTLRQWKTIPKDQKGFAVLLTDSMGNEVGIHKRRYVQGNIGRKLDALKDISPWGNISVYITDEKQKKPPEATIKEKTPDKKSE
jgi:hypothetical protein